MKRLIALLTALLVLLCTVPAMAATKTLVEKFQGQLLEQGFKGTVTFAASGSGTKAIGNDLWAWLVNAAPRLTLEANHSFANRADGQAELNVLIDGKAEGRTTLLYNGTLTAVSSDFLGGYESAWYTADRKWNPAVLLASSGGNQWPPVWHVLMAVEGASAEWKEKAGQHLALFETELGTWMNGFAEISTVKEKGTEYTQLHCLIPAEETKTEIKQLLASLYADADLLSLLREVLTAEEAAAYLQPGMLNSLCAMVDELALDSDVEITRRFNKKGEIALDRMRLPFADHQAVREINLTVTPDPDGQKWVVAGVLANGDDFEVSVAPGKNGAYSGAVTLTLPGTENRLAFDFDFSWDGGKEEYVLATDRAVQTMLAALNVKPHDTAKPAQELKLQITLTSPSAERSATQIEAVLNWRDTESDAALTASLTGRTAAPGTVTQISSLKKPVRVDQLKTADAAKLVEEWKKKAQSWIQDASGLLLPSTLPAESGETD